MSPELLHKILNRINNLENDVKEQQEEIDQLKDEVFNLRQSKKKSEVEVKKSSGNPSYDWNMYDEEGARKQFD